MLLIDALNQFKEPKVAPRPQPSNATANANANTNATPASAGTFDAAAAGRAQVLQASMARAVGPIVTSLGNVAGGGSSSSNSDSGSSASPPTPPPSGSRNPAAATTSATTTAATDTTTAAGHTSETTAGPSRAMNKQAALKVLATAAKGFNISRPIPGLSAVQWQVSDGEEKKERKKERKRRGCGR